MNEVIKFNSISNNTIKINVLRFFLTLGFLSFYLPNSESVSSTVYKLWMYAYLLVSASAILLYIKFVVIDDSLKKFNIRYVVAAVFYLYMYGITAFLTSTGEFQIYRCIYFFGFITLLDLGVHFMKEKDVIKSYLISGVIATLIYAASFVKYFNVVGGMHHGLGSKLGYGYVITEQNWYFFTYDNASVFIFLPIAAVFVYYCLRFDEKKFIYCLIYEALVLLMYILKDTVTAGLVFAIFTVASTVYFYKRTKRKKIKFSIDYKKTWLIILAFHIFILNIVGSDIAYKIAGYFGKNGSFTGRDAIWARAIKCISMSPLFGYGMEDTLLKSMKLIYSHCHNILLEIIYDGGIIGIALYVAFIILFKPKKETPENKIFNICFLCYLVAQGFETQLIFPYLIPIFYFNYYYGSKRTIGIDYRIRI